MKSSLVAVVAASIMLAGCTGTMERESLVRDEPYDSRQEYARSGCETKFWLYKNLLKPILNIAIESVEAVLKTSIDPEATIMSACVQKAMSGQ